MKDLNYQCKITNQTTNQLLCVNHNSLLNLQQFFSQRNIMTSSWTKLMVVFFLLCRAEVLHGSSSGAPSSTCGSMVPGHPESSSPPDESPIQVQLSNTTYVPDQTIFGETSHSIYVMSNIIKYSISSPTDSGLEVEVICWFSQILVSHSC